MAELTEWHVYSVRCDKDATVRVYLNGRLIEVRRG